MPGKELVMTPDQRLVHECNNLIHDTTNNSQVLLNALIKWLSSLEETSTQTLSEVETRLDDLERELVTSVASALESYTSRMVDRLVAVENRLSAQARDISSLAEDQRMTD